MSYQIKAKGRFSKSKSATRDWVVLSTGTVIAGENRPELTSADALIDWVLSRGNSSPPNLADRCFRQRTPPVPDNRCH